MDFYYSARVVNAYLLFRKKNIKNKNFSKMIFKHLHSYLRLQNMYGMHTSVKINSVARQSVFSNQLQYCYFCFCYLLFISLFQVFVCFHFVYVRSVNQDRGLLLFKPVKGYKQQQ